MAVTKQAYVLTPTWTAAQLATAFENAFINAGLMTAWHDSFLSGSVENRVLEITYNAAKTYGKTYYWFMFATSGVWQHVATGWDTTAKVPTGTALLDYFDTATNTTGSFWHICPMSSVTAATLFRYTSSTDAQDSWFCLVSGSTRRTFAIASAARTEQPWMDLDKGFFNGLAHVLATTSTHMGLLSFAVGPTLRRDIIRGSGFRGITAASNFAQLNVSNRLLGYAAVGNVNAATGNYDLATPFTFLPVGFNNTNPAYATDSSPVFHSMPYSPYIQQTLSSEFGICFHYATNTISPQDTFVVSAGVEEWEVLEFTAGSSALTNPSPLFLARVI